MSNEFDAHSYWESRHEKYAGDHRNVGNKTLTSQQNLEMITVKAALVSHRLGLHGIAQNAKVLDAGCGAGAFSGLLNQAGFKMTGVDGSPTAISQATATRKGRYLNKPVSDIDFSKEFDAVLCLDVLYHILEDAEWRASMKALCRSVSKEGILLIIESFDLEKSAAPHVKWRSLSDYETVLAHNDFEIIDNYVTKYPYEGIKKDLVVAKRRGNRLSRFLRLGKVSR